MKIKLITYLSFCYCIAVAICATSCGVPLKATIVGNYADYSYSAKSGLIIAPRFQRIKIYVDK